MIGDSPPRGSNGSLHNPSATLAVISTPICPTRQSNDATRLKKAVKLNIEDFVLCDPLTLIPVG